VTTENETSHTRHRLANIIVYTVTHNSHHELGHRATNHNVERAACDKSHLGKNRPHPTVMLNIP